MEIAGSVRSDKLYACVSNTTGFAEVNFFPFSMIEELPSELILSTTCQFGFAETLKSQSATNLLSITKKSSSKVFPPSKL